MNGQAPSSVVLIRPHRFRPNPQTTIDNTFQRRLLARPAEVAARARAEVDHLAAALDAAGIEVAVFEDEDELTPDSVFPNNWLSTHGDGTLVLYPMYAANRRAERRADVVDHLRERFTVRRVLDLSGHEREQRFLEGTGAMVLDHVGRRAYACRSRRLDPALFDRLCAELDLEPLLFDAVDRRGVPVYHTNVLMSVGAECAVVGSGMIRDAAQRGAVTASLRESGREVLEITEEQVGGFLGNCLELAGTDGPVLAMSQRAATQLSADQRRRLENRCQILSVPVPTIEAAGGSVRCMIAGVHLPAKEAADEAAREPARAAV